MKKLFYIVLFLNLLLITDCNVNNSNTVENESYEIINDDDNLTDIDKKVNTPLQKSSKLIFETNKKSKDYNENFEKNKDIKKNVTIYEYYNYGDINYILNDTMIVGKTNIVNMTISKNISQEIIINSVETFSESNIHTDIIRISPIIQAKLIDPTGINFKIVNITNEIQLIEKGDFTKWEWNVTPLNKGNNKLILTINIILNDRSKNIKVYEDFIYVYSDKSIFDIILDFFIMYWKWILSTLIIPLILFFYKKIK